MKLIDAKKLLIAIDQVHQLDSWEELEVATPRILDDLIGADLSCWNVTKNGEFIELSGTSEYMPALASLGEALVVNMGDHPIVNNTGVFSGEFTQDSHKMSDFTPQREFDETGLYREAYRHLDARYQIGTQVLLEGGMEVILTINRQLVDFEDDSLELIEEIKKHFATACRRLLRERELKERLTLLMDHASPGTRVSMTLDQNGRILETTGNVAEFLASHFRPTSNGLPTSLRRFLSRQVIAIEAGSRTFELNDDFGGKVKVTLLQTGFATRWTLLFHNETSSKSVSNRSEIGTLKSLSKREQEVLQWIAEGKTNPEIAILLSIAIRTVEKHCENIYEKLGVENRIAAAREWLDSGR